ncbi:MAG: hypothetical protein AAGA09_07625 [Pseudomonadota bacterium]
MTPLHQLLFTIVLGALIAVGIAEMRVYRPGACAEEAPARVVIAPDPQAEGGEGRARVFVFRGAPNDAWARRHLRARFSERMALEAGSVRRPCENTDD